MPWTLGASESSQSPVHISIYMDSFTEHGCLPAFLPLLGKRNKIITTQSLPEMPSWPSLPISTIHLFHKAFANIYSFQWRISEASKAVMSLKVPENNQREVSNISYWVGLCDHWDHALIHPFIYLLMHSYSFILSSNNFLWNANHKHHSARYWGYNGDQGWQVLCLCETDSLGEGTDIKSIMYISDRDPSRYCDGEAFVALRMWNSCAILARASWKAL